MNYVSLGATAAVSERAAPRDPAAIWGIHYPLVDHALKKISLVSVPLLTALPILVLALFFHRTLAADYAVWEVLDTGPKFRLLALALTSLLGSLLLFLSIAGKNATLASLIEIIAAA